MCSTTDTIDTILTEDDYCKEGEEELGQVRLAPEEQNMVAVAVSDQRLPGTAEGGAGSMIGGYEPDWTKIKSKMDDLPTIEKLRLETNPNAFTDEELNVAEMAVLDFVAADPKDEKELIKIQKVAMKKYKVSFKKSFLLAGYKRCLENGKLKERHAWLQSYMVSKGTRSQSGVLVVTVFTSAFPTVDPKTGKKQNFSCQWNCYYCPNEPGQPRSYLLNEPGVRRANNNDFDAIRQFRCRVDALVDIGHPADKVELLVLGGTWESYPESYRYEFIRDLFYAANTYEDVGQNLRPKQDLLQEQLMNESARSCKIIGVTLETRPDTIDLDMLVKLREYGCTRVQIGVQHTNDSILTAVNRDATRDDTVRAIKLLKDSCFKVDIHLMPDLPGTTPELDKAMFDDVLGSPELQADQWKIYPCQTVPFTLIKQWHEEGKYNPMSLEALIDVLKHAKRKVHPWIRLNRVIRDIPVEYILAGVECTNMRQLLEYQMKADGLGTCQCIRCREIKGDKNVAEKLRTAVTVQRTYDASEGREIFISVETPDHKTIFGFLRLRFMGPNAETPFNELKGTALIRELHVYGNLVHTVTNKGQAGSEAQHSGIGKRLLLRAEQVAVEHGFTKISVISGVGVRNYYRKRGYQMVEAHRGGFLIKDIRAAATEPLVKAFHSMVADAMGLGSEASGEDLDGRNGSLEDVAMRLFLLGFLLLIIVKAVWSFYAALYVGT